jgi:hypothetical protein
MSKAQEEFLKTGSEMSTASVIEKLPELLTWSGHDSTFDWVHDRYRQIVSEALGDLAVDVDRDDPVLGRSLLDTLGAASDEALLRVVLAPQASHLLLWEQPRSAGNAAGFLHRSLLAEQAKEGGPCAAVLTEPAWTALGDALVLPTGEVEAHHSIQGLMPLDIASPHVRNADPLGMHHVRPPWHPLNDTHLELAFKLLSQAGNGIAAASPAASAFTGQFIKVLVLQSDDEESIFAAYSTQQYPGRAVIANPQLVDATQIAEAIVHEAIHALLYMLLQTYPWGIDDPLYDDKPKVTSPWSGRNLPVSTFLHACFVWYGLLHFWSRALTTPEFPVTRVRGRMSRAALGFVGRPLLELVNDADRDRISAPIRIAIQGLQDRVMAAFAPAA